MADERAACQPHERMGFPPARVRLQLYVHEHLIGEWYVAANDLKVPTSTHDVYLLRARFAGLARRAAHWLTGPMGPPFQAAASLLLSEIVADQVRRHLQPDVGLAVHVGRELRAALEGQGVVGQPLWITLSEPLGFLAFVNWERLLSAVVTGPILRLSYYPLDPILTTTSLQVLLCCPGNASKAPANPKVVRSIVRGIFRGVDNRPCTIHFFTDAFSYSRLRDLRGGSAGQEIVVYDPHAAPPPVKRKSKGRRGRPRQPAQDEGQSVDRRRSVADHPWMTWMRRVLAGRAMDICHIVAPGELAGAEATLVVPADPLSSASDGARSRLVTAPYLAAVLELVGAPAALLGLRDGPLSRIAGRALADEVARRRPTMLAVHDLDRDASCRDVEGIYRFFATREPTLPPSGTNVTIFCHPAQVMKMPDVPAELDESLQQALRRARQAARELVDSPEPTPAWFAGAQRLLEQTVGEYLGQRPVGSRALAEHEGTRKALEVASRLLSRPETIEAASRGTGRPR
jgi:hypothetical protein